MSLRSVTRCPIDISLLPRAINEQRDLNRKKPYFFASALGVVICLMVFAFSVSRLSGLEQQRGEAAELQLKAVEGVDQQISGLNSKRGSAKGELEKVRKILGERNNWTRILEELQRITPDGMWYVVIEGVADKKQVEGGDGSSADSMMGGGDEGGGEVPVSRDAKDRKFDVATFPIAGKAGARRMREAPGDINFIRLVGYTVRLHGDVQTRVDKNNQKKRVVVADNDGRILKNMSERLKNSKFFKPNVEYVVNDKEKNFQRFEIFLELKEPVKK